MSPRRMDISSLLRDPSPPRTDHAHQPPASLLSLLNSPRDAPPRHSPASPPDHRRPFLALDALVHVASEERRRITTLSPSSAPPESGLPLDHDRPARHYTYPLPPSFHDTARPYKRTRDAGPSSPSRTPSPEPAFPLLPPYPTSPSTRYYPSASPTNNYPSLRPQPILHLEPTRSAPLLANDARPLSHAPALSLQHTSSYLHSPHPPLHSSPRNSSPHRHSPHLRPQHHSSPLHTGAFILASAEADAMSPRYGHGPRMAGGIEVFSNDSFSVRDPPRLDFSSYHSPGRDLSTEHSMSESYTELARHEPPKLSPLSTRLFSLDDDRHQVKVPYHKLEGQESVFPREWARSRPSHLPLVDVTTENTKNMALSVIEADFPAQHPLERHPIRVWEEQPMTHTASRRVSPPRVPVIVSDLAEGRTWSIASESGHGEQRLAREDRTTVLRQDIVENVPTLPSSICKELPPPRHPTSGPLISGLQAPVGATRLDSQPSLRIPMQPEPQAHLSQTSVLSSTPPAPASPVVDPRLENLETPTEHHPKQVDASTSVPLMSPDPIITEPVSGKAESMPMDPDPDTNLITSSLSRRPSPEPVQPVLALEPGMAGMSTHSTHDNVSQSTRSSLQPVSVLSSTRDERSPPPEDIAISPPIQSQSASRPSPEPEHVTKREAPVSEQSMMDVDEELLSLVEDRPARPVSAMPKARIDSRLPPSITVGPTIGASAQQGSRETPDGPSLVLPSQPVPKGPLMTDEEKDRASMPPPPARNRRVEKDKTASAAGTTASKKKKDGTSKSTAKPKQPPRPRAKPIPKPKARPNAADPPLKTSLTKSVVSVNARSRSTSVMPGAVDDTIVPEPEPDDSEKEDDKLYCVCKTRYDEDRMMIACDRCDEWFHTLCVNMPDLEIDLVDQFICPPCIQKHPHLRTTWKRRCLFGLQHEDPSSPEACHRPSRGVFSKYCSDDCGIKYMRARITQWEKSGGVRDLLWESVKNAAKREGVVICTVTNGTGPRMDNDNNSEPKPLDSTAKRRAEREVARLNARLEEVVKEREFMKRQLDMVMWREKVVELASERAGKVDECGWDQRLCFGEEEWADFGPEVLESYEEERVKVETGDDVMLLDAASTMHGEWWCTGKKKCERHVGWQKLRAAEASFDKETKEGILLKLTTREREIRKGIEDILYPQPTSSLQAPRPEVQLNGSEKPNSKSHVLETGKKRTL